MAYRAALASDDTDTASTAALRLAIVLDLRGDLVAAREYYELAVSSGGDRTVELAAGNLC